MTIPTLDGDDTALAPPRLLRRSYPSGRKRYLRRYRGQVLTLTITLAKADPQARLAIFTNLGAETPGEWHTLPMTSEDGRNFVLELPLEERGAFCWRARYSPDGGDSWLWDRVTESWIMVDPEYVANVKMYTLIPSVSGTWRDWLELLPAVRDMGYTMLHLLPLTRMDASQSPYAAADLFEVDPAYLDPKDPRPGAEQIHDFAQQAADLGLGICVDLVLNHVGINSHVARRRPQWIAADEHEPDGFRRAGWQGPDGWNAWRDLAFLHYSHPHDATRLALWKYMRDYARFWAGLSHRTGGMIRLDNLHSTYEPFANYLLDDLRHEYPGLMIFAELFTSQEVNERLVLEYGLNLLLGTQWEHHFTPELRRYLVYIHDHGTQVRYFMPISTHDSGTPTEEFGDPKSTLPRYAISCFYGHGLTGLTQGVEVGLKSKLDFIGKPAVQTIPELSNFRPTIRRFHDILDAHDTFREPGNLLFIDGQHDAILGAWRGPDGGRGEGFILLVNLDIFGNQTIELDFQRYGLDLSGRHARDLVSHELVDLRSNRLQIVMPPCGVQVIRVGRRTDA